MLLIKINWQFIWLGGCCLRVVVSLHSAFLMILKIRCFLWGLLLNFNWSIQRGKCYTFQCTWLRTFSIHEHTVCSTRMCCLKIEIFASILVCEPEFLVFDVWLDEKQYYLEYLSKKYEGLILVRKFLNNFWISGIVWMFQKFRKQRNFTNF
jgi:hypothetical protein